MGALESRRPAIIRTKVAAAMGVEKLPHVPRAKFMSTVSALD
jgi:hypothetical protein